MPKLLEALGWLAETWPEPGSKGLVQARMPLAKHAMVEDQSIARWIRDQKIPKGETVFRVGFFLESFFGVKIEEMDGSNEYDVKELTRTFGSGVVPMERISEILDFADRTDSVLRLLRGRSGTSEARLGLIRSINQDFSIDVENVREKIKSYKPHAGISCVVSEVIHEPKKEESLSALEEAILLYGKINILPVMEIMELLVFADNSRLRDEFRRRMGDLWGRFSKLSSALTSEQARAARISDGLKPKGAR